jgi:hypothetical protein
MWTLTGLEVPLVMGSDNQNLIYNGNRLQGSCVLSVHSSRVTRYNLRKVAACRVGQNLAATEG